MFLRERLTAARANVTYFQDVIVATPGRRNMVMMVINTTHNAVDVSAPIKFVVIISQYFHTTNTKHNTDFKYNRKACRYKSCCYCNIISKKRNIVACNGINI